jgi:spore maturation protein CgeB
VESQQRERGSTIVKPDSLAERLWRLAPARIKQIMKEPLSRVLKSLKISYYSDIYEQLDFAETFERFFRDTPRCPVYSKAISSRHFDAVGTRTCQVMLEGRYNDILKPDEHFIALRRDFSNIDDAMERFRDTTYRQAMVDRTYEYVMAQHTYRHRVDAVRDLI